MAPTPVAGPSNANAPPTFTLNNTIIASRGSLVQGIYVDDFTVKVQASESVQKCS